MTMKNNSGVKLGVDSGSMFDLIYGGGWQLISTPMRKRAEPTFTLDKHPTLETFHHSTHLHHRAHSIHPYLMNCITTFSTIVTL